MKDWRTEKRTYMVVETSRKGSEEYVLYMTGKEISDWCKVKNENNGYIPGIGGDKSYSCVAWQMIG